jgi:class 3 adenylate cyclase
MKGSMELLADRDPEDARKLLDPVLEHMMEAVHRYEGTVNQVMGDGIGATRSRLQAAAESLRTNGEGIDNVKNFPFMLSPSKRS